MARGAEFEPRVKPAVPLSVRVYNFLISNGAVCLRDVYEALGEKPSRVDDCFRRLWKKCLILRTAERNFQFEVNHKGRAGCVGYTRAINYYVVNNCHEIPANFVSYEDRKKDGRSRDVESKASRLLNFLKDNKDKAFYSVDIAKELEIKSCDVMSNVRRFEKKRSSIR